MLFPQLFYIIHLGYWLGGDPAEILVILVKLKGDTPSVYRWLSIQNCAHLVDVGLKFVRSFN